MSPPLADDRLPVVMVVLEGLGDRPVSALGGSTPAEAAATPVLDELAHRGASGLLLPFGWGRAVTAELAFWSLLGYEELLFCGRAVLEAIGTGADVGPDDVVALAGLRTSEERDGAIWVTGTATAGDAADAAELMAALEAGLSDCRLQPIGTGEAILTLHGACSGAITDTDPLQPDRHPMLRPRSLAGHPEASTDAQALAGMLGDARRLLSGHPVNARRRAAGAPALDLLTTREAGRRLPVPPFTERAGCAGAMVTSSPADRALAILTNMAAAHSEPLPDPGADMGYRVALAGKLVDRGAAVVVVRCDAPAVAARAKDPPAKRDMIEALDRGLAHLPALAERAVVAVLADGAAPSSGSLARSADPGPLVVSGPSIRSDGVDRFGEGPAAGGAYGALRASAVLPLLLGLANRPWVVGHRPARSISAGMPDHPEAFPLEP